MNSQNWGNIRDWFFSERSFDCGFMYLGMLGLDVWSVAHRNLVHNMERVNSCCRTIRSRLNGRTWSWFRQTHVVIGHVSRSCWTRCKLLTPHDGRATSELFNHILVASALWWAEALISRLMNNCSAPAHNESWVVWNTRRVQRDTIYRRNLAHLICRLYYSNRYKWNATDHSLPAFSEAFLKCSSDYFSISNLQASDEHS